MKGFQGGQYFMWKENTYAARHLALKTKVTKWCFLDLLQYQKDANFCSVIFCYLDNFSEKLNRKADSTNPYTKNMEEAIAVYRAAAEKTFLFTRPGECFREPEDESIGNFFTFIYKL